MPRVLIIKTSSMGDVVHNLPVVADIRRALPGAVIDWVVEEGYADLVRLASGVDRVIPVALRRWRQERRLGRTRDERRAFLDELTRERYDVVLDTQGLLKSALVARRARLAPGGARIGFSFGLVREGLARLFYDRGYAVDQRLHAIERMRALAAAAFGYGPIVDLPRFGLDVPPQRFEWLETVAGGLPHPAAGYVVLLHATARPEKAWPAERWIALIDLLCAAGLTPVLPSGNAVERAAAEALARGAAAASPGTVRKTRPVVAPTMSLATVASLLCGADAVVGVDTGLLHLAAALDVPTVGLFGATPRWRYAPYWSSNAISLGGFGELGAQPDVAAIVDALVRLGVLPLPPAVPPARDRAA